MGERNLYRILGVPEDAPPEMIRRAYRLIALRCHPDINPDIEAAEEFLLATDAYELLSDPAQRAAYDAQRRARVSSEEDPLTVPPASSKFHGSAAEAEAAWKHIQKLEAMWAEAQRREEAAVKAAMVPKEPKYTGELFMQLFWIALIAGVIALLGWLVSVVFFW